MLLNASPRKTALYLFIICLIVLSMPMFLRIKFMDGAFIGPEAYSNFRIASLIDERGFVKYDDLSFSGRELRYEHGFLGLLALSPEVLSWILPIIFGLASFLLFYFIVKRYDSDMAMISSLLLAVSPCFIYLFSVSTKFSGAVFFFLVGLYLYVRGDGWCRYLSYFSFLLIGLFSIEVSILAVLAGLFFAYSKKIDWRAYLVWAALMFGLLYLQFGRLLLNFGEFFRVFYSGDFLLSLSVLFSDLSGSYGFGVFMFILALAGIYSFWREKYRYIIAYFLTSVVLILAVYQPYLIFFLNFLIALFAACGVIYLIDMEWKSSVFRSITLLVIICGLLFSAVSFLNNITEVEPSHDCLDAINYLSGNVNEGAVVFSDYTRGVYINIAGKKNVADSNFIGVDDFNERLSDSEKLFHAKKMEQAREILDKYNIKYVWMDREMKERIYGSDDSELLFLLKYATNDFYREYGNDEVEIWGVYSRR